MATVKLFVLDDVKGAHRVIESGDVVVNASGDPVDFSQDIAEVLAVGNDAGGLNIDNVGDITITGAAQVEGGTLDVGVASTTTGAINLATAGSSATIPIAFGTSAVIGMYSGDGYDFYIQRGSGTLDGSLPYVAVTLTGISAYTNEAGGSSSLFRASGSGSADGAQIRLASQATNTTGDIVIHMSIDSTVEWSFGIDNSASDQFKISKSSALGTSDVFASDGTNSVHSGTAWTQSVDSNVTSHITILNVNTGVAAAAQLSLNTYSATGDAFITLRVESSPVRWSFGIDNSASNSFKISHNQTLGVNDYISIDTSGNIFVLPGTSIGLGNSNTAYWYVQSADQMAFSVYSASDPVIGFTNTENTTGGMLVRLSTSGSGDVRLQFDTNGGTDWFMGIDNDDGDKFKIATSFFGAADKFTIDANGNVVIGAPAVLNTTATDGFLHIPVMNGTPTSAPPTTFTGKVPMVFDETNDRLYIYTGAGWRAASINVA